MNNIEKVLNSSSSKTIDDIEFKVSAKIETIISELIAGKTDSLQELSYIVRGDPTSMKVYELISSILRRELDTLKPYQLTAVWLDTEAGNEYYEYNDLNKLYFDEYDIFNYAYNHIDFYKYSDYSEEYFLELLDKQCWLETTIEECDIFYRKLHDEIINKIEYDDFSVMIPDFVDSLRDIQFYYIYGRNIDNLDFKDYKSHILYKTTKLIEKNGINKDFFNDMVLVFESFERYADNSKFYSLLPPIYFAKEIMDSEIFDFFWAPSEYVKFQFIDINSGNIIEIARRENMDYREFVDKILDTTIYDMCIYGSIKHNELKRWDKDKSDNNHSAFAKKELPDNKENTWQSIIKKFFLNMILIPLLYIYFMGAGISATYFNWQFAKENGFVQWIFLGEIIPTLQGAIWPYYLTKHSLNSRSSQPKDRFDKKELDSYIKSIEMRNEAINIINAPIGPMKTRTLSKKEMDIYLGLLYKSLENSQNVSDKTLALLHPDLPNHYRNEFQKGLNLYIEGIEQADKDKLEKGELYFDHFGDWYSNSFKQ